MLIGLNTFPLGVYKKQICSVCSAEGVDFACKTPVVPTVQADQLRASAFVGSTIELYDGQDALAVSCDNQCLSISEFNCFPLALGRARYFLFIHNGNVYASIKSGRVGEQVSITATITREYEQKIVTVAAQVTIRN